MKLQTKLICSQVVLSAVPIVVVAAIGLWQALTAFHKSAAQSEVGLKANTDQARTALTAAQVMDLNHIAENLRAMCAAQDVAMRQTLNASLATARALLRDAGQLSLGEETAWEATNQLTKDKQSVQLPKLLVNKTWLGRNEETGVPSPVVDAVKEQTGATCTILQRMNTKGDLLRVCTNVLGADGKRAIGTYVPAVQANGVPNAVNAAVMQGQAFHGRAFVADAWYATAYEPIKDQNGEVIGALYVGLRESDLLAGVRETIMKIKVGKTGYVYILNAKDEQRGRYVISKDGARDGENIWDAKDADGKPFIQEICNKALTLKSGEVGETRYPWKNTGETTARYKIVRLAYYEPWDWVIGVGAYEDEVFAAVTEMDASAAKALATINDVNTNATRSMLTLTGIVAGLAVLIAGVVAFLMARGMAKPIERVIVELTEGANQVNEAAAQVSSAAQELAAGASEQASSLEETSSSLEEMSAMTRSNADGAQQVNALSDSAKAGAEQGGGGGAAAR